MIRKQQKQYIEDNINLIRDSEWVEFFKDAPAGTGRILYEAGFDFLRHVDEIPPYCFFESNIKTINIPDNIKSIGKFAFYMCSSLTSVTIPDSVTIIGNWAFKGCIGLTNITIPDSVTSIGEYALGNCHSLKSVTIGNGVTRIGETAFIGCSSLTSVTIPNSVVRIGEHSFSDCGHIDIKYDGTKAKWKDLVTGNNIFKGTTYICNCIDGVVKKSR